MRVECLEVVNLDPRDAGEIGALVRATWPPKPGSHSKPVGNQAYDGPAAWRPRRLVIRAPESGRIVSHGHFWGREIEARGRRRVIAALAGVCTYPEFRGRGYGRAIVRTVFDLVDAGDFEASLFQTCVPKFYEKMGCRVVPNRLVNSLGEDPAARPFWDPWVMAYPAAAALGDGTIDLRGPGY